mgnify:CR=1 FL=1
MFMWKNIFFMYERGGRVMAIFDNANKKLAKKLRILKMLRQQADYHLKVPLLLEYILFPMWISIKTAPC